MKLKAIVLFVVFFTFSNCVPSITIERTEFNRLPPKVKNWVKNCKMVDIARFGSVYETKDKQYIFVRSGKKEKNYPKIIRIIPEEKNLKVVVLFKKGMKNKYDIVHIKNTKLPVVFIQRGEDNYRPITTLSGIKELKGIVSQSNSIKIFTPPPFMVVKNKITVEGIAMVPEATVYYRLTNSEGKIMKQHFVTAADSLNWGYFEFELELNQIKTPFLFLELYFEDWETGKERDLVTIKLKVQNE